MAQGKGNAATVDATASDGAGTDEGAPTETKQKKARPNRSYVVVPMPGDLKARFENEAKAADKPVGPYVLGLLAQSLGIEIPVTVTARRSKYNSDEERKAAQKARNQNRSATMRDLMAAFRDAQKAGANPEEAARIASEAMLKLLQNGPSQPAGDQSPSQAEAEPATA